MIAFDKLGNYLKEVRKSHLYTQKEAAEAAGISDRQLSNIERGRSEMKLETAQDLCDVYGITLGDLSQFSVKDETKEANLDYLHKITADRKVKKK